MTDFMNFVDKGDFTELFEELGWDQAPRSLKPVSVQRITVGGTGEPEVTAEPVASQDGLTVWVVRSTSLPSVTLQRSVDDKVRQFSAVRLIIFTDGTHQSWRWPRSGATAATNQRLLHHHYTVGDEEQHDDLARRLAMIELKIGERIGITEIQARMAKAFNDEAVRRSQQASGHMKRMNQTLLDADVSTDSASSLLVRLLFLFFGDDTRMWPTNTFQNWVLHHTTGENIHAKLTELFAVLCDPELDGCLVAPGEKRKGRYAGTEFEDFRRIDGMYRERVELPSLNEDFRQQVMEAGDFDWAKVNPDIFGAMFQQLVDPAQLREMGEHYTSEENIQKVIEPLFLDEYRQKFEDAYDDRKELLAIQDELASLQFLDPACGCGNFLIQAYKHLRGLEFEILRRAEELERAEVEDMVTRHSKGETVPGIRAAEKRLKELNNASIQYGVEVLQDSKLSMRQFFGIEINPWPAKVASTAMLLVDHLCNQAWGENVVRLPIQETPEIMCANALRTDWNKVVPDTSRTLYVFGNPPFVGQKEKTTEQTNDMKQVWGENYDGYLDYVTGWHAKSKDLLAGRSGLFAFVTTNSITQGQPVPALFGPLYRESWDIKFAHRTFAWDSDALGKAAVHCVIIGFTRGEESQHLWDYTSQQGAPFEVPVSVGINAYLIDGPKVLVTKRMAPLSQSSAVIESGSKAVDWGFYTFKTKSDLDAIAADAVAMSYVRRFLGGDELIKGKDRWCLWLEDATAADVKSSPELTARVHEVQTRRANSDRTATKKAAATPLLFGERRQPKGDYLGIPQTFSQRRKYATVAPLPADVIASIKLFTVDDPDGYLFALLSSSMFLTWQKAVGGRIKSDPSFSNTIVWNNLPIPNLDEKTRADLIEAGKDILRARAIYPARSLAEAYDPKKMDPELVKAHDTLDTVVDKAFGADHSLTTERERLELLFTRYAEMTRE
ncbi:DNA methyltransferase [Corynebacterium variabile]|uniref:DNA methyltransferase n=1 Tax=Corynebacterium variabile TaxID=1727 RepID=UPI0028AABBD0|nr:DNA methyltransferase [Corynebacterium variabile]